MYIHRAQNSLLGHNQDMKLIRCNQTWKVKNFTAYLEITMHKALSVYVADGTNNLMKDIQKVVPVTIFNVTTEPVFKVL